VAPDTAATANDPINEPALVSSGLKDEARFVRRGEIFISLRSISKRQI